MALMIRPMCDDDVSYITATFRVGYKRFVTRDRDEVLHVARHMATQLFDRKWSASIAVDENNQSEIAGYVVYRPGKYVVWIYVRGGLRKLGIAKRLIEHTGTVAPHPCPWPSRESVKRGMARIKPGCIV